MGVIDDGIKNRILTKFNTKLQNEILHESLTKRCTDDALKAVCDVIIGVVGNPRMRALGEDMKKGLAAGEWCACVHVAMHVHVCELWLVLFEPWFS